MAKRLMLILGAALLLLPAAEARAEVRLTIQDGRVSLVATNATLREILAEWARVGQTKIVNGDRIAGSPMSIELTQVPEDRALDIILRSVSGYIAAPRPVWIANASRYDRIMVMPTSSPPRTTAAAPPAFTQSQPQFVPPAPQSNDDSDDGPPGAPMPPPQRGPVFNTFPTPQPVPQIENGGVPQPAATPTPGAPAGVARPGMIVRPPQPQGGPGGQPQPQE